MNEATYILWRRAKAWGSRLCFYLCRIFPIHRNRVNVCTFEGKGGFGCNPKYIVQELHRRCPDLEIVWMVNDAAKEMPSYVRKVRNTLLNRAYWLSTAKVWIDNYRKPYGTAKRKGQYYLNTNHYTFGIKCTGLWRGAGFSKMAYLVSADDSKNIDALVTDSAWCDAVMPKAMLFAEPYLKAGAPRCDILFGDRSEPRKALRERHNLPKDAKIVLYAPTFREGAKNGKRSVFSERWTLDFPRLLAALARRFGGTWHLCTRVHPQLAPTFEAYRDERMKGRMFDESKADDMYEILAGVDAYITDYSSAIFEAGFARIPGFIYADDIEKYAQDRGSLMWNLAVDPHTHVTNNKIVTPSLDLTLPFPVASENEELAGRIEQFDIADYERRMEAFMQMCSVVFDGKGASRIADCLEQRLAE